MESCHIFVSIELNMFYPHLSTLTEYSIIYFSGEIYFHNFNIILMMYLYNTFKNDLNKLRIK